MKNTIKVGSIELGVNADGKEFVPTESNLINSVDEQETIALGIRENLPVLLIGDTGTGKTSLIRHLAYQTNNAFRRLNLNGSTTVDELVGHYTADGTGLKWIDGVLTDAMKKGYWLLLDELNAGLPEVLFVLQSLLDDDRFIVIAEHEGEVVRPHENFRIFASMNPSLEYAGTKDMNKALLSRFPIVIQTTYPDPDKEVAIIRLHAPHVTEKQAGLMVRVAEEIRKGKANNSISFICSTRELINWGKLTKFKTPKEACELALLNKVELPSDKKTVEDILKLQVGRWDKRTVLSISDLEAQLSLAKNRINQLEVQADSNRIADERD